MCSSDLYRETLGSTAPDKYSGYRGILQRYQISNGRQNTLTALAQQGIPPPPSHAFAWNSTDPMIAWLAAFRHHTYQTHCNIIHSKTATHCTQTGDDTDPWRLFIIQRRKIDASDPNFHHWQQQHLSNNKLPRHNHPLPMDARDYIGIGATLNTNIYVTSTADNATTSACSLASTSTPVYLNAFMPTHYDIQQHPTDSPRASHNHAQAATTRVPAEGAVNPLAQPGTLQNRTEEEAAESEEEEPQNQSTTYQRDDGKKQHVGPRIQNAAERK